MKGAGWLLEHSPAPLIAFIAWFSSSHGRHAVYVVFIPGQDAPVSVTVCCLQVKCHTTSPTLSLDCTAPVLMLGTDLCICIEKTVQLACVLPYFGVYGNPCFEVLSKHCRPAYDSVVEAGVAITAIEGCAAFGIADSCHSRWHRQERGSFPWPVKGRTFRVMA